VDIQYIPLDLASLSSIKEAAEHFNRNNSRLDILVLNAGVMAEPAARTPDGYEIQFGTNHVGHFLLTKLLLPTLLKTTKNQPDADVRVVSVSSAANFIAPANHDLYEAMTSTEKLLELTTWQRYGISKAANILFASELARRYPAIKSVALHPGIVSTQLYDGTRETNQTAKYGLSVAMRLAFRSTQSGALNQLWAAAGARKDELVNGGYYTPIGLRLDHNRFSEDKELAKNLWDWTDNDISKKLGAL
jgi:NAD(P)-dependent dehydrogenase (short-subunit alcohol dehydrogenase family)